MKIEDAGGFSKIGGSSPNFFGAGWFCFLLASENEEENAPEGFSGLGRGAET